MTDSLFNQSYFNEAMNGFIFILAFCAVIVFCRYMWSTRTDTYYERRPALAITAVFIGDAFIRFSFWFGRHITNVGQIPDDALFYSMAVVGGAIQAWGILCCMKVFAPDHCSVKVWLLALICAIMWNVLWMAQFFV